jgi:hypothetical protein
VVPLHFRIPRPIVTRAVRAGLVCGAQEWYTTSPTRFKFSCNFNAVRPKSAGPLLGTILPSTLCSGLTFAPLRVSLSPPPLGHPQERPRKDCSEGDGERVGVRGSRELQAIDGEFSCQRRLPRRLQPRGDATGRGCLLRNHEEGSSPSETGCLSAPASRRLCDPAARCSRPQGDRHFRPAPPCRPGSAMCLAAVPGSAP